MISAISICIDPIQHIILIQAFKYSLRSPPPTRRCSVFFLRITYELWQEVCEAATLHDLYVIVILPALA